MLPQYGYIICTKYLEETTHHRRYNPKPQIRTWQSVHLTEHCSRTSREHRKCCGVQGENFLPHGGCHNAAVGSDGCPQMAFDLTELVVFRRSMWPTKATACGGIVRMRRWKQTWDRREKMWELWQWQSIKDLAPVDLFFVIFASSMHCWHLLTVLHYVTVHYVTDRGQSTTSLHYDTCNQLLCCIRLTEMLHYVNGNQLLHFFAILSRRLLAGRGMVVIQTNATPVPLWTLSPMTFLDSGVNIELLKVVLLTHESLWFYVYK